MPRLLSACPSNARAPTVRAIAIARSQAARVLLAGGAEHPDLGLGREHARERGRRRVGRQHAHGVAVGGQGAVAVARQPQVAAEALACQRRGDHVAGGVGQLDRHAAEGDRAVVLARDEHALCRVGRDGRQAELGALVGVLDELPDLQRPLEVLSGLGEGEDLLGLQPGAHVGRQGLGHPVRGTPVVRQLGGGRPVAEAGVLAERLGERQVQRGPLAREQVRVGGLLQQGVAEGVAVGVLDEDVLGHRVAQPRDQRGLGQWRDRREQPMARPPAGRGGHAQHARARRRAAPRAAGSGRRAGSTAAGPRRHRRPRAAPRRRRRCPRSAHAGARRGRARRAPPRMPATCSASSAWREGLDLAGARRPRGAPPRPGTGAADGCGAARRCGRCRPAAGARRAGRAPARRGTRASSGRPSAGPRRRRRRATRRPAGPAACAAGRRAAPGPAPRRCRSCPRPARRAGGSR